MKFTQFIIFAAIAVLPLASANAGSGSGVVRSIQTLNQGVTIVRFDTHDSRPGCATVVGQFAFDGSTPDGKAKLAVLLAAASQKKPVSVSGLGSCTIWGDRETLTSVIADF